MDFEFIDESIRYFLCGWADIHVSAYYGDIIGIRRLLQDGADVNCVNINGETPLHLASRMVNDGFFIFLRFFKISLTVVREILKHKPQMNLRDDFNRTPLNILVARARYDIELLETYLKNRANPNIADKYGRTPLHHIVKYPLADRDTWLRSIELMISYKAGVNFADEDGNTVLHIAAMHGFVDVVDLLLERHANINLKNRENYTPIDIAFTLIDRDVLDSLGKHLLVQYSLNMAVNERNVEMILEMECFEEFWQQCNTELDQLKKDKIGDTVYSYYHIMTLPTQKMSKIFRNKKTQTLALHYETEIFKIYGQHLFDCLERAMMRNNCVTIASEFCKRVMPWMQDIIIDKITSFLSNEELKNLAKVINMDTSHLIIDYV